MFRLIQAKDSGRPIIDNLGGTFWTKSEPISPKILTLTFDCRPTGDNPAQRFRPPPFCLPADAGIAETLSYPQPTSRLRRGFGGQVGAEQTGPIAIFHFAQDATG